MFDPQTKSRADGRPRILINDGFAAHKSLEVLQFCYENNILCRLPSHASYKLQIYNFAIFGPFKMAYRNLVKDSYHGGAACKDVGKQHFTFLYSQARYAAFTSRNIKSG
jgi:hypothetical protein